MMMRLRHFIALAALATINLVLAGQPWGVVYGFGLWGAKAATGASDHQYRHRPERRYRLRAVQLDRHPEWPGRPAYRIGRGI